MNYIPLPDGSGNLMGSQAEALRWAADLVAEVREGRGPRISKQYKASLDYWDVPLPPGVTVVGGVNG